QLAAAWQCICRCWYPAGSAPLKRLACLWRQVFAALLHEIFRQPCEQIKCILRSVALFSQNDFVAALQYFHFLGLESEFLGQAYSLAIAGLKNTSGSHRRSPLRIYTASIYI